MIKKCLKNIFNLNNYIKFRATARYHDRINVFDQLVSIPLLSYFINAIQYVAMSVIVSFINTSTHV